MALYYTYIKSPSPFGPLLLTGTKTKLTGLYFRDAFHIPAIGKEWERADAHPLFRRMEKEVAEFAAGKRRKFTIPFDAKGTPFQMKVWKAIDAIPYGKTLSYSELAAQAGSPRAVRAAGAAAGKNRVCLRVPCHRVVGKDGALTGYVGGVKRKKALLALETAR